MNLDFSKLKSGEVLIESALSEYEKKGSFFFSELVTLNTSLHIVEKLIDFPFSIFTIPSNNNFFNAIFDNFYLACILRITRLATDNKSDLETLLNFKNFVRRSVKNKYKSDFDKLLKSVKFETKIRESLEKTRELRNYRLAHSKDETVSFVTLKEMQEITQTLNNLLDTLSFDTNHLFLPIEYAPNVIQTNKNYKTDIEEILDFVAQKSTRLHLPEKRAGSWKSLREKYPEKDLEKFNNYRRKFGLPKA